MYNSLIDCLRLIRSDRIGPATFWSLMKIYGTASKAIENMPEMAKRGGGKIPYKIFPKELAEKEIKSLEKLGGFFIKWNDELFPYLLLQTNDPPPILSVIGEKKCFSEFNKKTFLAVAGARNASLNAQKFCFKICEELGRNGFIIISGLARGIDSQAHLGSLASGTIAVLAGGVDIPYPSENEPLYKKIIESGIILSEMPLGSLPQSVLFPRRNRIIAGSSIGVLVIEAALKSGSLITAQHAIDYSREVMAVPGFPLDPRCKGTNSLLKNGAVLVENIEDIINALRKPKIMYEKEEPVFEIQEVSEKDVNKAREQLITLIGASPVLIDELIRSINSHPSAVLTAIIELELAGKITRITGQKVHLNL